ncbi:ATP-binding protein [soil metagenome]
MRKTEAPSLRSVSEEGVGRADGYSDPFEELADHARLLALRVERALARMRDERGPSPTAGAAIFDREVDAVVRRVGGPPAALADESICQQMAVVRARSVATTSAAAIPLRTMRERLGMNEAALDLCLLCLGPELFAGYGRLYAYLQDDAARAHPTVALALDVLADTWTDRLELAAALQTGSDLLRKRVITVSSTGELTLAPAVVRHLLSPLRPAESKQTELTSLVLAAATRAQVDSLLPSLKGSHHDEAILLVGEEGSGRSTLAAAIASALGQTLRTRPPDGDATRDSFEHWLLETRLNDQIPLIDVSQLPADQAVRALRSAATSFAEWQFHLAFVTCDAAPPVRDGFTVIELAPLDAAERAEGWRRALAEHDLSFDDLQLSSVASVFPLSAGQIGAAASAAAVATQRANAGSSHLELSTWRAACRGRGNHRLDRMAQRLPTVHDWSDLVLPPDQHAQLHELASAAETREQVLERWSFGQKVSPSAGVSALFFGPSGTGKTMAAGVLANHLGMDLFRIDLSRVVSKYIGETEKNLESLFNEAKRAHAVLFFDEADALFGKRSEVKDAHDRYANIEVAYLLQRMEMHEGITVLATNLKKNLDEAFLRRLQFSVEFPHPSARQRREIWRKVWPAAAPLAADLDLDFVASNLELSGGQIKNIALKAAYLAASDGTDISMSHLIAAVRREHQKLGRLTVEDSFGPYRELFARLEAR